MKMDEEFARTWFDQGIESRPIARLSDEHQCAVGGSLLRVALLRLLLDPGGGKHFVHARRLATDAHRGEEALAFLLCA